MNRALPCTRATTTLVAVAMLVAGCAGANNTTSSQTSSQTSNQGEQPYKTMYGLTSEGTTTDLYTEFFGPRQPPATAVAATQPVQPVTPGQQPAEATRPGQAATATAANRTSQSVTAQPAPVQVAQQPPPTPEEPDVPTAYGITAKGPTTDLYTAIFGSKQ